MVLVLPYVRDRNCTACIPYDARHEAVFHVGKVGAYGCWTCAFGDDRTLSRKSAAVSNRSPVSIETDSSSQRKVAVQFLRSAHTFINPALTPGSPSLAVSR